LAIPSFWAIGWFLYEDYEKAGFFYVANRQKDKGTALQVILYTDGLL
jgi:protoheme IX farnesyltransferase